VFEIGVSLRNAREHQKLALSDVERATHIRTKYLAALEEERWDVPPGPAYVKGFLRTYADFLGLDGATFVAEFNERFTQEEAFEPPPLVRVRPRRRFLDARLLVAPLAIALGLLGWKLASSGEGGGRTHRAYAPPPPSSTHVRTTTPTTTQKPRTPAPVHLELVAARGACWLTVRLGSESGRTLYSRMLEPGRRATFVGRRLWIRYGAPWNVDATVNGERAQLPTAVGDVVYP
jgi:cytoskeleton protein RodZ